MSPIIVIIIGRNRWNTNQLMQNKNWRKKQISKLNGLTSVRDT